MYGYLQYLSYTCCVYVCVCVCTGSYVKYIGLAKKIVWILWKNSNELFGQPNISYWGLWLKKFERHGSNERSINFTVTQIWIPEVYPGMEAEGRFVGVIHAGREIIILNCIELNNSAEKAMAPHSSTLAWKIPWTEEPGRLQSMGSLRVGHDWETLLSLFHFHALEKEIAAHSSVLAWRIPGMGEPGGLLSMGSHRVRHD